MSGWRGHNVLGIVAPTVEAATQTPWAVTSPQYPQKYNTDLIAVFGTTRTIASHVYPEEIRKRCPKVTVVQQTCARARRRHRARRARDRARRAWSSRACAALLAQTGGAPPHRAILGCTHFPLVEHLFRRHLPPFTRILSQPEVVADSLEDYLQRHPRYVEDAAAGPAAAGLRRPCCSPPASLRASAPPPASSGPRRRRSGICRRRVSPGCAGQSHPALRERFFDLLASSAPLVPIGMRAWSSRRMPTKGAPLASSRTSRSR